MILPRTGKTIYSFSMLTNLGGAPNIYEVFVDSSIEINKQVKSSVLSPVELTFLLGKSQPTECLNKILLAIRNYEEKKAIEQFGGAGTK